MNLRSACPSKGVPTVGLWVENSMYDSGHSRKL